MKDIAVEIREAVDAGERALTSLRSAQRELNSAKTWGVFDMLGGSWFSTLAKHSKMQNAKRSMEQARYDLKSFSDELRDVDTACDLTLETNDFLNFADWFFDGFVVDWMIQERIVRAGREVSEAIRLTERITNELKASQAEPRMN